MKVAKNVENLGDAAFVKAKGTWYRARKCHKVSCFTLTLLVPRDLLVVRLRKKLTLMSLYFSVAKHSPGPRRSVAI